MAWSRQSTLTMATVALILGGILVLQMTWMKNFFISTSYINRLTPTDGPDRVQLVRPEPGSSESRREFILRDLTLLPGAQTLAGPHTAWDDPALIAFIREELLDPPRPHLTKFSYPLFKTPQAKAVDRILNSKKGGFFVECGALDGERSSNTNWLEQKRGWTGLLVEMDPSYYLQLRGKNRKSYSSNVCLSPEEYPTIINFREHPHGSGRLVTENDTDDGSILPTLCVPLYSLMLAMNITKIDYFSLDVEGFEAPIISSIPFDKLDISVLTVEYTNQFDRHQTGNSKVTDDRIEFMEGKGYVFHSQIDEVIESISLYARDHVFVKKNLQV